jgi:hypothetical protein
MGLTVLWLAEPLAHRPTLMVVLLEPILVRVEQAVAAAAQHD